MKFVKMHGCGNSYIYMDVRGKNLCDEYLGALSEKVADKNKGIGSDGLIVLDDSQVADGRMRMYNADGSEGAMCGNGIRCLAKLMYERAGIRKEELAIETKSGIKTVKVVLENGVVKGATVDMGSPDFTATHIPVLTETAAFEASVKSGARLSSDEKANGTSSDEKGKRTSFDEKGNGTSSAEKGSRTSSDEEGSLISSGERDRLTREEEEGTAAGSERITGKAENAAIAASGRKMFIDTEEETIILPDEDGLSPVRETEKEDTEISVVLDDADDELSFSREKESEPSEELSIVLDEEDDNLFSMENGEKHGDGHGTGIDGKEFINQPVLIKNGDGDIEDFTITCVSMGNPHAVTFVDKISRDDFAVIGPKFENNAIFPDRINTEFVKKIDRGHVKMRVWERGSGETMACGTGACATVAAGVKTGRLDTRVEVEMTGGTLSLFYDTETNHIYMTGEAVEICEGELLL